MSEQPDRSKSGAPIHRHKARSGGPDLALGDEISIAKIVEHIEKHVGSSEFVFHEVLSDLVHIDVHVVSPTPKHNYFTLVTSGMSDRPMTAPANFPQYRFAEIMICLPPTWRLRQEDLKNENYYWPIRWLKTLARLPHQYKTWLFRGHTAPNGDPAQPFANNTDLCCALLMQPILFDPDFKQLEVDSEKTIHILSLIPLYPEEMEFKLDNGLDALVDRLDAENISELLDVQRDSICFDD